MNKPTKKAPSLWVEESPKELTLQPADTNKEVEEGRTSEVIDYLVVWGS